MLKNRLIPIILTKKSLVVQSNRFKTYRPIGDIKTAIEFYVNWDVDEIIIIDIDATKENRLLNKEILKWASKECFVPLTVGGGIKNLRDISSLLRAGADKITVNSRILNDLDFIKKASKRFGSQCISVSIDCIKTKVGYKVYDYLSRNITELSPYKMARRAAAFGAGEILLNSVDRDGIGNGYDIELLKSVSSQVSIPIIACGGVGQYSHLSEGILKGGCQAVAAANIFLHSELSTIAAKSHMLRNEINVRLSSFVKYDEFEFDDFGRPY